MDGRVASIMIRMLASALESKEPIRVSALGEEEASALYGLSKSHDLAHIVGSVLAQSGTQIPTEYSGKFQKQQNLATFRCLGMQVEKERIYAALENAAIPFMPLKGSVIREYYPVPEMRTSSDIDILVHPEDLDRAMGVFKDELQYDVGYKNVYDVSMFSPGGVHVELHFSLAEDDPALDKILLGAWDDAVPKKNSTYCYRMSDEMFYVNCIAHMAKHFVNGGCGVRPLMDLWVIEHKIGYDKAAAAKLLNACRLTAFAEQADLLMQVWFGEKAHTDVTREMEAYILGGGVFGIKENKVAIASQKQGSGFRYAMSRIFLSKKKLQLYYTRLEKYPILYPYYLVKRWFRILFSKDRKNALGELKRTATVDQDKKERLATLCKELELF